MAAKVYFEDIQTYEDPRAYAEESFKGWEW